ncbi:Transposase and inactivated derivatives, IS30 family [Serratia fonticola]|nr:Transposase and inactivated derivatives, IS30 family [Serratia fonticola]
MKYQQLTWGQRYYTTLLYEGDFSYREIDKRVGVRKSTASRALRRTDTLGRSESEKSQNLCEELWVALSKRTIGQSVIYFVEFALKWNWSPEQVSGEGSKCQDRIGTH